MAPPFEPSPIAPIDEHRLTRRDVFPLVGGAALAALAAPTIASAQREDDHDDDGQDRVHAPSRFVYVGTYTTMAPGGVKPSTSKGIYVFRMNGANGALSLVQVVELVDPSWVTIDSSLSHPVRNERSFDLERYPE